MQHFYPLHSQDRKHEKSEDDSRANNETPKDPPSWIDDQDYDPSAYVADDYGGDPYSVVGVGGDVGEHPPYGIQDRKRRDGE